MSIAEKMLSEKWDHTEDAMRVEDIAAHDPKLADGIGRLALRFIDERGLSGEFADLLEEIQGIQAASNRSPGEDGPGA
jgi:hypothetical protein